MASAFVFCALLCLAFASGTTAQGIAERRAEASAPPPLGLAPPNLDGNGGNISGFDAAAYKCVASVVIRICMPQQDATSVRLTCSQPLME